MVDETEVIDAPEIGIDADLQDAPPILGQIQVDRWTKGRDGQTQWMYAIKPYNIEVRGETGMLPVWCNVSLQNRSKMGVAIKAFRKVFGANNPDGSGTYKIGKGQYIGREAWFKRETLTFGRDRDTGKVIEVEILVPFKTATPEEIEEAKAQMPSRQEGTQDAVGVAAPAKLDLSDDDVEVLLALYTGKTVKEAQFAAPKAGLTPELKQAVMSGKAWKALQEKGVAGLDADNKVVAYPQPA